MEIQEAPVFEIDELVSSPAPPPRTFSFGLCIFLSAFLLFQLELIVAKHILPWFGGSSAVWTTCMLFFQAVMLAGYAFAHWSSSRLSSCTQAKLQLLLIALASLLFISAVLAWRSPLTPGGFLRQTLIAYPVLHILLVLILGAGAPFFLLSTTAPLLQNWFRLGREGDSSYRLYALSNIGSLFGLLSYPFLFEWLFDLRKQAWLWNVLFIAFLAVCAIVCRQMILSPTPDSGPALFVSSRPS